ncbi:MAG TPA: hypothetical protein VHS06_02960, partial [Chloroflexota bacterium]|nr:hypothetical protein [Chloroflexota bacterium]
TDRHIQPSLGYINADKVGFLIHRSLLQMAHPCMMRALMPWQLFGLMMRGRGDQRYVSVF